MIDLKELIKSGVHFGHRKSVGSPAMAPFIWGFKNSVHLIDVSKTAYNLEKAAKFLESVVLDGKPILWVGTKKPAQNIVYAAANGLGMPYVTHRWIGGTLSNFSQVKKSVTKLLHYEDILAKASKYPYYTKKELNSFQKDVDRLKKNVGGIVNLKWPIGAIVLIDIKKEQSALREAVVMGIPVVALVDTNSDPSLVDYIIPGNDDSPRSIKCVVNYLEQAVRHGQEAAATKKAEEKKEKEEIVVEEAAPIVIDEDVEEDDEKKSKRAAKKATEEIKRKVVKKVVKKDDDDEKVSSKSKQQSKSIKSSIKQTGNSISKAKKSESGN